MSLDGLRAWIGEVERKLGMRTRVFLVLTVLALGGAGAAIYLAIDARDSSVNESDVQTLQQELETRIGSGGADAVAGTQVAQLEAELRALQAEVAELKGGGTGGQGQGEGATGASSDGGSNAPSGVTPDSATGGAPSAAELEEQLQPGKEGSAEGK